MTECAEYLGVSVPTVSIQLRRGTFPRKRPDGYWHQEDLDAYVATKQNSARPTRREMASGKAKKAGKNEPQASDGISPDEVEELGKQAAEQLKEELKGPIDNDTVLRARGRKIIADALRAEHEALIAELKLQRLRGESCDRRVVESTFRDVAARQAQILFSLHAELLPKLHVLSNEEWASEADAFLQRVCAPMAELLAGWDPNKVEVDEE